jgi:hypothetical protein
LEWLCRRGDRRCASEELPEGAGREGTSAAISNALRLTQEAKRRVVEISLLGSAPTNDFAITGWMGAANKGCCTALVPIDPRMIQCFYAMIVILATAIGLFAPPFGVGYYGACAIGRVSPDDALWRIWPYIGALVIALAIVAAIPWILVGFCDGA